MSNLRHSGFLVAAASLLCPALSLAFDYSPTPLSKSLTEHSTVLVAKVDHAEGGKVVVVPVEMIKGRREMSYTLPSVWRLGTEFIFGPIRLEVGQQYLLMLSQDEKGKPILSKDFAADAVVPVKTPRDTIVRAAAISYDLLVQARDAKARSRTLAHAFEHETDETNYRLLQEFYIGKSDEATVPFLIQCMDAGSERSSLMEYSALVIQRHGYKSAIPGLLRTLKKHDWACLYPARTLCKLKAREAYEPVMALINDKKVGNREYLIHALCYLEDPRSVPFLIETLQGYQGTNRHLHRSWIEPLQSAVNIPDEDLQDLAAIMLGRLGQPTDPPLPQPEADDTKPEPEE